MEAEEQRARAYISNFVQEREREALEHRSQALKDLTTARDAYDALRKDDRISATEYAQQMEELRRQQDRAENMLAQLENTAEELERYEDDPLSAYDELQRRIPKLRTEFPW
jgi:hypothetical protein